MAKLGSYYGLCPIIDQKSLLGINNDSQPGQVLVTLGKNIAIKYKLSDQKQLISWRTKEKFTSPVVYYKKEEKYCAVFNKTYLRLWSVEDEQLDKLDKHKKLKFNKPIHTLYNCGSQSFVIFQNGAIVSLEKALKERRELVPFDVLKENEKITNVLMMQTKTNVIYGGLLIQQGNTNELEFVWSTSDHTTNSGDFFRIKLQKPNLRLSGCVLTSHGNEIVLLSLWSDGKMYSHSLVENTEESFLTIMDSISCKENVTLYALNEDYLAMYAADNAEEGAVLLIYNIQFKVTQCKQPFKMYTSGTKIWCLESYLFLCVGQNLAVIPYHLDTEQLAALVGSHKTKNNDPDIAIVQELVVTRWDDTKKARKKKQAPDARILELSQQGWPESSIIEDVLPKYMEDNDLGAIKLCLDYFEDIPEEVRVKSLNYLLTLDGKHFNKSTETNAKLPDSLAPMERCLLIDKILVAPFSSIVLLPQLRLHLPLTNALLLLRYVCYLLSEDGHSIGGESDVAKGERKLVDWGCILLDANYQKFLLTKDQKIVEILNYFNELVKAHICCLDEIQQLAPIVDNMKSGKCQKGKNINHVKYSIEELVLI